MSVNIESKSWVNNVGIVISTCCIIIGVTFFFFTETSLRTTSFGGDFYTYTYKGLVAIEAILIKLVKLWSISLIFIGSLLDCHFISEKQKISQLRMQRTMEQYKNNNRPMI